MCTLQTGKLCYNAININYILCSNAELQESSISHLSWSFIKEFAVSSCIPLMLRSAVYVDTGYVNKVMSWPVTYTPGIELEMAWSKVSTKVCGFTFGSISLHLISKRIKEILIQKQQYNAKYLSQFNDKNAFRKHKKNLYIFSRFRLYE